MSKRKKQKEEKIEKYAGYLLSDSPSLASPSNWK